jgi:hypothetical protein
LYRQITVLLFHLTFFNNIKFILKTHRALST